jgi:hypothetical protein
VDLQRDLFYRGLRACPGIVRYVRVPASPSSHDVDDRITLAEKTSLQSEPPSWTSPIFRNLDAERFGIFQSSLSLATRPSSHSGLWLTCSRASVGGKVADGSVRRTVHAVHRQLWPQVVVWFKWHTYGHLCVLPVRNRQCPLNFGQVHLTDHWACQCF